MANLTKRNNINPAQLEQWGVNPESQINYYDGKILIYDDSDPDGGIGIMVKAGVSCLAGIAVFTHAPLIGVTFMLTSITFKPFQLDGLGLQLRPRIDQDATLA